MIISDNILTLKSTDFLISESGFEYSIHRLSIQIWVIQRFCLETPWNMKNGKLSGKRWMKCYNKRKDSIFCFCNEPNSTKNFEIVEKVGEGDASVKLNQEKNPAELCQKSRFFGETSATYWEKIKSGGYLWYAMNLMKAWCFSKPDHLGNTSRFQGVIKPEVWLTRREMWPGIKNGIGSFPKHKIWGLVNFWLFYSRVNDSAWSLHATQAKSMKQYQHNCCSMVPI